MVGLNLEGGLRRFLAANVTQFGTNGAKTSAFGKPSGAGVHGGVAFRVFCLCSLIDNGAGVEDINDAISINKRRRLNCNYLCPNSACAPWPVR
jgi:hypothetical protein